MKTKTSTQPITAWGWTHTIQDDELTTINGNQPTTLEHRKLMQRRRMLKHLLKVKE